MPTPISNYGELRTSIVNWLQKPNLSGEIPTFVQLAENRIANELDMPNIEKTLDVTINAKRVALPSDFLEQRRAYIDVSDPVQRINFRAPESFWDYDRGKGVDFPRHYTIEGNELVFSPSPDSTNPGYAGKWLYMARPLRLSADTDSNDILLEHTALYLYGSLLEAEGRLDNDSRVLTWATMYDDAMDRALNLGRRKRFPKGQKVMRSKIPVSSGMRTKM